jgi:LysM domain
MAVKMEKPQPCLPPTYRPANALPYRVKNGDSFVSVAARLGITPKQLLLFNFNTDNPLHVNYYLQHNLGCSVPTADGKNLTFKNARPGILYQPAVPAVVFLGNREGAPGNLTHQTVHGPLILDKPEDHDFIQVRIAFVMAMVLNARILDPLFFEYRQFIRADCRVADEKDNWHSFGFRTARKPHQLPSDMSKADTVYADPVVFREDVEYNKDTGVVRKYGYRSELPQDIDRYHPNQAGHAYQCIDVPKVNVPKTNLRAPDVQGPPSGRIPRKIEVSFGFKAQVIELIPDHTPKVHAERSWSYSSRWRIKERYPLDVEPY